MADSERRWWKECVVYQIYPQSFKDSTGSGIGDLNGIRSKLKYLRDLGVDVIWLSPIYASPMKDMGYDISNYTAINPTMGTMHDWEALVVETHDLGMKLVMDLVVNHTSDQHEWFINSKAGGSKKDWYIWRPPKEGHEPNNWGAIFGGSCWEWNESLEEYYLHVFDPSQPDLNWENPEVREAIWEVMRFWLDKGCDGFRMDVINCISKEPGYPDVPVVDSSQKFQYGLLHRFNGPNVIPYLNEMDEKVLKHYPDVFTVGETPGVDKPEQALSYLQAGQPLQMIFHFEHMYMDQEPGKTCFYPQTWKLTDLKNILGKFMIYMQENNGWDSLYLENHDQPRIVSRWADEKEYRVQAAKMLALFHVTGRGTVFLYQGQEIGMANAQRWTFEELRDVEEINHYNAELLRRGPEADMADVLEDIRRIGRDNSRMPMSWDASPNAGFSQGKPWIKVNDDYREWNIAKQEEDGDSVLAFWKQVLAIRKSELALTYGKIEMIDWENENVYAYERTLPHTKLLIVCSFVAKSLDWTHVSALGELLISNYANIDQHNSSRTLHLRPYECRLYKIKQGTASSQEC